MSILSFFKKSKYKALDIQLGAYYAKKLTAGYEIIRLLDYTGGAFHYQLIESDLTAIPSIRELKRLAPVILHIPVEPDVLIGSEIQRIGHVTLTKNDLRGYAVYLEEMGADGDSIETHLDQIVEFSRHEPEVIRFDFV